MPSYEPVLTFSVVSKTLLAAVSPRISHADFIEHVFCNNSDENRSFSCDNASKLVNGTRAIPLSYIKEFASDTHLMYLTQEIKSYFLPKIMSPSRVMEELRARIAEDYNHFFLSPEDKDRLLQGTTEEQIAKIVQYACITSHLKPYELHPLNTIFDDVDLPLKRDPFVGRDKELKRIDSMLQHNPVLFVRGIHGIGKTALVCAYAKTKQKVFDQIVYIKYADSLSDTLKSLTVSAPFRRDPRCKKDNVIGRFKLLQSLSPNTLLILDGVDQPLAEDPLYDQFHGLNCHVLVLTSGSVKDIKYPKYSLNEIKDDASLLDLFYAYCPKDDLIDSTDAEILKIIKHVSCHTYAIKLLAKTLKRDFSSASVLYDNLDQQTIKFPRLSISIDGEKIQKPCFALFTSVLGMQQLHAEDRKVLKLFLLTHPHGLRKRHFAELSESSPDAIEHVLDLGWLEEDERTHVIAMPGFVRYVIATNYQLKAADCEPFLSNVSAACQSYCVPTLSCDVTPKVIELNQCLLSIDRMFSQEDLPAQFYRRQFTLFSHLLQCYDVLAVASYATLTPYDAAALPVAIINICQTGRALLQLHLHALQKIPGKSIRAGSYSRSVYDRTIQAFETFSGHFAELEQAAQQMSPPEASSFSENEKYTVQLLTYLASSSQPADLLL